MSATDYLMKPLQVDKLRAALDKAVRNPSVAENKHLPVLQQNLQQEGSRKIVVPVTNGLEILNLKDICYFKADGSYTQICFASDDRLLVSKNLKHFEFILAGINSFMRIHRSFIVNIHYAKRIHRKDGGTLVLENEAELPVAEDKMEGLIEALSKL
jgi:two-component system LytT family response regulator